jgi:hypothetical protein
LESNIFAMPIWEAFYCCLAGILRSFVSIRRILAQKRKKVQPGRPAGNVCQGMGAFGCVYPLHPPVEVLQ